MKKLIYLFIALTVGVTLYSCHGKSEDDPEPTPPVKVDPYSFRVAIHNGKGDDISASGDVSEATLYIFDESGSYLESLAVTADQIKNKEVITLEDYPSTQKLTIVTWGGLAGKNQDAPTLTKGSSTLSDLKVMLQQASGIANSPDRLYHGTLATTARAAETVQDIVIAPKIARLQVIVIGLEKFEGRAAVDASLLVDRTKSGFDYNGDQIGSDVSYTPGLGEGEDGNQVTPITNMLPTDELGVELTVMGKTFNVTTDDNGDPLHAVSDNMVAVVMRVAPDPVDNTVKLISVKVEVADWNEVIEYPVVEPDENL